MEAINSIAIGELPSVCEFGVRRQVSAPASSQVEMVHMTKAVDIGYGRTSKKTRCEKPYTEDTCTFVNLENHTFMICADGHGGSFEFSDFAIKRTIRFCFESFDADNIAYSLCLMVAVIDQESRLPYNNFGMNGGTTFVVACVDKRGNRVYVANLGDSRCVVVRDGTVLFETTDLDVKNVQEQERIKSVPGAYISSDQYGVPRLNGMLMTTAGFGDFSYTTNGCDPVRRVPDISIVDIKKGDAIVVTSDGLFEKLGGSTPICSGKQVEILARDVKRGIDENVPDLARFLLDEHVTFMCSEYTRIFDPTHKYSPLEIRRQINECSDNKCVLAYLI